MASPQGQLLGAATNFIRETVAEGHTVYTVYTGYTTLAVTL